MGAFFCKFRSYSEHWTRISSIFWCLYERREHPPHPSQICRNFSSHGQNVDLPKYLY